ncbi:MAG: 4Fe-4S binding protein [Halarsenatibacteraceae bacterium]
MISKLLWRVFSTEVLPAEIKIDKAKCSNNNRSFLACKQCSQSCPDHEIDFLKKLPEEPVDCRGCGICIASCPTGAIGFKFLDQLNSFSKLLKAAQEDTRVIPVCNKIKEGTDGEVFIGCLGRLSSPELLLAAVYNREFILPFESCASINCSNLNLVREQLLENIEEIAQYIDNAHQYFHFKRPVTSREAENPALSRRDIFRNITNKSEDIINIFYEAGKSELIENINNEKTKNLTSKKILQFLLKSISQNQDLIELDYKIGYRPEIEADNCIYCRKCEKLCPQGAIKLEEDSLEYYPGRCIDCRTCVNNCNQNAIEFNQELKIRDFIKNRLKYRLDFNLRKCVKCKTYFNQNDNQDKCYICESKGR